MSINKSLVKVDKRRNESIELQLIDAIIHHSQSLLFANENALPSARELADQIGVDNETVDSAYKSLIQKHWIVKQGSEYYIKPFVFSSFFYSRIVSIYDQIKVAGYEPSFQITDLQSVSKLNLKIDNKSYYLSTGMYSNRVFYASGIPIIIYESYVNGAIVDLSKIDHNLPLYSQITNKCGVNLHHSKRFLRATALTAGQCDLLQLPHGSVGMRVVAETYDEKNQLIEVIIGISTSHYQIIY